MKKDVFKIISIWAFLLLTISCTTAGGGQGFEKESSQPINAAEALLYKKALTQCHASGGSRIVKIDSKLQCF